MSDSSEKSIYNSSVIARKLDKRNEPVLRFIKASNEEVHTHLDDETLLGMQDIMCREFELQSNKIQTKINSRNKSLVKEWFVYVEFENGQSKQTSVFASSHNQAYTIASCKFWPHKIYKSIIELRS